MRNGLFSISAVMVTALTITTPAFAEADAEASDKKPPSCLRQSQVNGFNVIDREHLVLRSGASKHWLVTLRNRCSNLRHEHQIAVKGTGAGCLSKFDQILVHNNGFNDRCLIKSIEFVEDTKTAKALVEQRLAEEEASKADG